jgi:hypothetical protein
MTIDCSTKTFIGIIGYGVMGYGDLRRSGSRLLVGLRERKPVCWVVICFRNPLYSSAAEVCDLVDRYPYRLLIIAYRPPKRVSAHRVAYNTFILYSHLYNMPRTMFSNGRVWWSPDHRSTIMKVAIRNICRQACGAAVMLSDSRNVHTTSYILVIFPCIPLNKFDHFCTSPLPRISLRSTLSWLTSI